MARGRLRIYLGASPGVGKTYAMLAEGRRRRDRGTDVVVGYVETHGRAQTAAQLGDLEIVPRKAVSYRGATLPEMDVEAVLARRPQVALVDEYAHTNAPGSPNEKRWQDVELLLDAGIDVITTLNIQHLESLNDVVQRITGVVQRETVPDAMARRAEQIELVDMTPEAIRRRMEHGNIYPAERVPAALDNYFRPGNLGALRELALLWLADRVEETLAAYLDAHGIADTWETRERVLVALSGAPSAERIIRRAARMAGRAGGELLAVHVTTDDGLAAASSDTLTRTRRLVEELGGRWYETVGHDAAEALAAFAQREKATQVVLGATRRSRWEEALRGSFVARVTRLLGDIDVHVIATDQPGVPLSAARRVAAPGFDRRRQLAAWVLVVAGLPLLTAALHPLRGHVNLTTLLLAELSVVVGIAALGGIVVGIVAAVLASLLVNWFFVPPYHTFTIAAPENVVALVVFVVVAGAVGVLVTVNARRLVEARRARLEAEALARSATALAADPHPVPALLDEVRASFGLDGVALRSAGAEPVAVGDTSGAASRRLVLASAPGAELALFGAPVGGVDERLLVAFGDQLATAAEHQRLAEEAATAAGLAEVDAVRTGLLQAVSHDLRTPLASIKAMVTGLLDPDVTFPPEQVTEALELVDAETDRLNRLVGNLLDASRLQTGALAVHPETADVRDTISAAIASVGDGAVTVDAPDHPLLARFDPTLLERSLANVLANAQRHRPPGTSVSINARPVDDAIQVTIADHGPGIPLAERERVLAPFQRLGDDPIGDGVGLGLAIAHGFVDAMHGTFTLTETAGGGLTVSVVVPGPQREPGTA